ncbi:HEAT repeat domain-containing protein [Nocardia sp. NPDC058633]|uniref:HEAT repeat domain-containing protein n=1 Tax=Nocardia sp. NPDC058633 TaxID=3346568 RepID=UPI0036519959
MTAADDEAATRLLDEYRRAGGYADTIPEIGSRLQNSPAVIVVITQWLTELEDRWPGLETDGRDMARLSLTNALNRKESRKTAAIPALISQFDHAKAASARVRWAAGNALYKIPAGKEYFEQLAAIAADRRFGADRQMVVDWLGKSKHPDAAAVAAAQLDDETVQGHALDALSKMRAQGVRDLVEPFLTSKFPWHRRNAERIIRYDEG